MTQYEELSTRGEAGALLRELLGLQLGDLLSLTSPAATGSKDEEECTDKTPQQEQPIHTPRSARLSPFSRTVPILNLSYLCFLLCPIVLYLSSNLRQTKPDKEGEHKIPPSKPQRFFR